MNAIHPETLGCLRKNRLAAMVTGVLALCGSAHANTIFLTSCTDTGVADTGNLRNSILAAGEGDTIDLGLLTCPNSRISLLLGQIPITRNNLTIQRMGTPITIDGLTNGQAGMLRHTGTGTLSLIMMSLSHGYVSNSNAQTAQGGCVYSAGNVYMNGTTLSHCLASTLSGKAYGGAAYTKGQFKAKYSTISQNNVNAFGATGTAAGGGVFSKGGFDINLTSIRDNTATGTVNGVGICAGACITGTTSIQSSTISGNAAHARIAGISVFAKTSTVLIQDSTISGNTAANGPIGGVLAYAAAMNINNSTIVLNTAATGNFGGGATYAPGLSASYGQLSMTSSLIANNGYGVANTQNDLTLAHGATLATISNNLVRTTLVALPSTLTNVCPVLGALRDNGGLTKTHALLSHSPAIDTGANPANLQEDQRGKPIDVLTPPLPFQRVSGTTADIGAFEVQQNDEIFSTEFEGCP